MADDTTPTFNTNKYASVTGEVHRTNSTQRPGITTHAFSDGSDDLANLKNSIIGFKHLPSGKSVFFKAFVTQFGENFDSTWERTAVFGRADPIIQFRNTQRSISIGWNIPAASLSEGIENLEKVQNLVRYQYPSYNTNSGGPLDGEYNALGMTAPPLVRLKFMNMITNAGPNNATVSVGTPRNMRRRLGMRADRASGARPGSVTFEGGTDTGLLGVISNITINHHVEGDAGVFHGNGAIVPKLIEVTMEFNPIHEDLLGWNMASDKWIPSRDKNGGATNPASSTLHRSTAMGGFSDFDKAKYAGYVGNKMQTSLAAHSSFPYGIGPDFDPLLQGETLEAMRSAQGDRVALLQDRADKEAARQIAEVRHAGFLGGVFKRADAKYYNKRMRDPSLKKDPYRMAAGYAAAGYPAGTDDEGGG
jgi:hypothetical protein